MHLAVQAEVPSLPFAEVRPVRRIDRSAAADLQLCEQAAARGTPLVFEDGAPDVLRSWDFSFLRRELGRARFTCWVSPGGRVLCRNDGDLDDFVAPAQRSVEIGRYHSFCLTLEEAISRILGEPGHAPLLREGEKLYVSGDAMLGGRDPGRAPYMPRGTKLGGLWLSQHGATTTLHWDNRPGFLAVAHGHKRVVLVPSHVDMQSFPRHDRRWRQSRFTDLAKISAEGHPEIVSSHCWVVDLRPGDVLLIPPLVWHEVTTIRSCVSVTFGVEWPEIGDAISRFASLFGASGPFSRIPRRTARILMTRLFRAYKRRPLLPTDSTP